jgi:hypothetical protein
MGCYDDHSRPSSAEDKNEELYLLSPLAPKLHSRGALLYYSETS